MTPVQRIDAGGSPCQLQVAGVPAAGMAITGGSAVRIDFLLPSQARGVQVTVQNNTAYTVTRSFTDVASAGALAIPPGCERAEVVNQSFVSIYCASAITLNGTSACLVVEVFA